MATLNTTFTTEEVILDTTFSTDGARLLQGPQGESGTDVIVTALTDLSTTGFATEVTSITEASSLDELIGFLVTVVKRLQSIS